MHQLLFTLFQHSTVQHSVHLSYGLPHVVKIQTLAITSPLPSALCSSPATSLALWAWSWTFTV